MDDVFSSWPLWGTAALAATVVFVTLLIGYAAGVWQSKRDGNRDAGPVGAAAAACLGLVAFLLAITFSMAASRLDTRKELLLEETNAIGTAWLRADLLEASQRQSVRRLLTEYVDIRAGIHDAQDVAAAIARSKEIHDRLWAIGLVGAHRSAASALFVQSVNDVVDLHGKRVVFGLQYRIPPPIWLAFMIVTGMAMVSLGYMFGLAGAFRYPVSIALSLAFSAVILLIADIDRPQEGFIRVDLQPLIDLQRDFRTAS